MDLIPLSGRSLEEEMATHSSILAWETPWTEELGGLQSMGSQSQTRLCKEQEADCASQAHVGKGVRMEAPGVGGTNSEQRTGQEFIQASWLPACWAHRWSLTSQSHVSEPQVQLSLHCTSLLTPRWRQAASGWRDGGEQNPASSSVSHHPGGVHRGPPPPQGPFGLIGPLQSSPQLAS